MALLLIGLLLAAVYAYAKSQDNFDDLGDLEMHDESYPGYVVDFAQAIAHAEGYGIAGAIPTTHNNPGDIEYRGQIVPFPSLQDGWNTLYRQVELMFDNRSRVYNSGMSIAEIASKYTQTEESAWTANVVDKLSRMGYDVSPGTTLDELKG